MLKSIQTRAYMAHHPLTFRSGTDLYTAIALLLEHRQSAAPVVDGEGHPLGMLTEAACLKGSLDAAYYEDSRNTVDACMASLPLLDADSDILSAARLLLDGGHAQLAVVHEGVLVGVLGCQEVLRAVKEFAQHSPQTDEA